MWLVRSNMNKQIPIIKTLIVVYLIVACSNAMDLSCNTPCGTSEEGMTSFQRNETCCVEEFEFDKATSGIPPRLPELTANWYVYTTPEGDVVAFNVTWIDRSSIAFTNHSDGYVLDIVPSASQGIQYIFKVNKKSYVKSEDKAVHMSYVLYGRDKYFRVDMEKVYMIMMRSLPWPYLSKINEENVHIILYMPACSNHRVSHTLNCIPEKDPRNHSGIYRQDYPDYAIPEVPEEIETKNVPNPALIPSMIALCGFILTSIAVCLFCLFRMPQGPLSKRKLFVVISSKECSSKSLHSQAGDELCCCLRDIGMDVTFTLWSTTEMVTTDAIKWVNKNVAEADHVIVIQKSEHDKIITRTSHDHHGCPEKESLLNPTFDPYNIICELIRVTDDAKNKFSAVHFKEASKKYLDNIFQVQSYRLPENIIGLLRKISGRRRVPSSLKEKFEGKLANVTDKIRAKAISENNAMSTSVPVKNLSNTESIAFMDEQPDSGYLTRQDMSLPVANDDTDIRTN